MAFYLPFLNPNNRHLAGLDISSTAVKLIELAKEAKGHRLLHYGTAPLPSKAIIENEIKDIQAVAEAIKLAHARSLSSTRHVAIALPDSQIITKRLLVDASLSDNEQYEYIQLEAAHHIPYSLDEVALDFDIIDINQKDPLKLDVILVAARNEQVYNRVEAVSLAGLIPQIVDVESFCLQRVAHLMTQSMVKEDKDRIGVIVDIGSVSTTIVFLHNNQLIHYQDELWGSFRLTETIQQRYHLSQEDAEKIKCNPLVNDEYQTEILNPFKESFIPLLHRTFQSFFSNFPFNEIDYIILGGGGALTPDLVGLITERFKIPCTLANPFSSLPLHPRINPTLLEMDAPKLMIATGLALREHKR